MAKRTRGGRTSREELRKSKEKRLGYAKFVAALLLAAVIGGVYILVRQGLRDLDEVTLCPEKPSSLTVLVVDVTDPMNVP